MEKRIYHRPYINNADRIWNGAKPKDIKENEHHTPPKSRLEKESEQYTQRLFYTIHANYEWFAGNALMQEAMAQLVNINWVALSDNFLRDIHELINMQDDYVYRDWIWIKR